MSEIIRYAYGLGIYVCQSVGHALVRDLTNYNWHVEEAEFEKQQELHFSCQEFSKEKDGLIAKVDDEFTTVKNSIIPAHMEISSKESISTHKIDDIENFLTSGYKTNSEYSVCPSDDSDHYRYSSNGKSIINDSKNIVNSFDSLSKYENKTYGMPVEQISCNYYIESWWELPAGNKKTDRYLGNEKNIIETKELQENRSEDGTIKLNKSELKSCSIENEVEKTDRKPEGTSSTNQSLEENIKEASNTLQKSRLGIIETFSDLESMCFDDQLLQELISEKPQQFTTQDINIDKNLIVNDNMEKSNCLNALYFDAGDDMRYDILSEEQLQSIETSSTSDWLYSATGIPVICLQFGDNNFSVTQEEIKCIQDQEKMFELCKATDENILKESYVKQWLIDTNQYTTVNKVFSDGDFL